MRNDDRSLPTSPRPQDDSLSPTVRPAHAPHTGRGRSGPTATDAHRRRVDASPARETTSSQFRVQWADTAAGRRVPTNGAWAYDDTSPSFDLRDAVRLLALAAILCGVASAVWRLVG